MGLIWEESGVIDGPYELKRNAAFDFAQERWRLLPDYLNHSSAR
jgi:hypothetical protein